MVTLLIVVLLAALIWYILGKIAMTPSTRQVIRIVLVVLVVLWLLGYFGVFAGLRV